MPVGLMTSAYCVPALTLSGVASVAVRKPELPSENPVTVPDARSAPVGSPPDVARSESVRSGVVPLQPEQNRLTSTCVSGPLTDGVKVWPPQLVVVIPTPLVPSVSVLWLIGVWSINRTFPGLAVRSQSDGTPRWKASCVLSVKQPLIGEASSVKFHVALPPLGTPTLDAEAESKPALLAVKEAYVPDGTVNV
jgi:hypothetical protein